MAHIQILDTYHFFYFRERTFSVPSATASSFLFDSYPFPVSLDGVEADFLIQRKGCWNLEAE